MQRGNPVRLGFPTARGGAARAIGDVTFMADQPATFPIVCVAHKPAMVAEQIVAAKK